MENGSSAVISNPCLFPGARACVCPSQDLLPACNSRLWICLLLCVCLCAKSLQSWPTLCDSTNCSLLGSSIHGILQARILEWIAMPFSKGSAWPRAPSLQADSLPLSHWESSVSFCRTSQLLCLLSRVHPSQGSHRTFSAWNSPSPNDWPSSELGLRMQTEKSNEPVTRGISDHPRARASHSEIPLRGTSE